MPFNLIGAGMMTAVGYDSPSSCAAIRAAIDGFSQTRFMIDGDWLLGAQVSLPGGPRGRAKILQMAVSAIDECLAAVDPGAEDVGLALALPDPSQPGVIADLDRGLEQHLRVQLRHARRLLPAQATILHGRMGAVDGLLWAERVLDADRARYCVVAGVDSLLTAGTLAAYRDERRLITNNNRDGFRPGEGAAAVLLSRSQGSGLSLQCLGIGAGNEPATLASGKPLRADGLVQAYRSAFASAGCGYEQIDYRITDISGEQFAFKEASLAMARTMRVRKPFFDLWHPADCVGEIGAAMVPLVLGVALSAARKEYAPGPGVLCHCGDATGRRAALVLRERRDSGWRPARQE